MSSNLIFASPVVPGDQAPTPIPTLKTEPLLLSPRKI